MKKESIKEENQALSYYKKGLAFVKLNNYDQALDCYNSAIELGLNNVPIRLNMSMAALKLGRMHEANQFCDEAILLDPSSYYSYYCKGMVNYELQEYQSAIKAHNKAIELCPEKQMLTIVKVCA